MPKNAHYTFDRLLDPRGGGMNSTTILYGVTAIPVKYVIGKDGKVVGSTVGGEPGAIEALLREEGIKI